MSGDLSFKDASELLEGARQARLQMVVFASDAQVPGEVASLSRMLWKHIPELAKRSGVEIDPDEGHPPQVSTSNEWLSRTITLDMAESRPVAQWLSAITSPQTKAMFAKGSENAMDAVLQKFSEVNGFERRDSLTIEAGTTPPLSQEEQRPKIAAAAVASYVTAQRAYAR